MKKDTKKPKKKVPKKKPAPKKGQSQRQSQSVIVNVNTTKPRRKSTRTTPGIKTPNYLDTITTFPIFREAPPQISMYSNPEPTETPYKLVDKTTLNTTLPISARTPESLVRPIKIKIFERPLKTESLPKSNFEFIRTRKEGKKLDYTSDDSMATINPPIRLIRRGRPKKAPLSESEIIMKKTKINEQNRIRRLKRNMDKNIVQNKEDITIKDFFPSEIPKPTDSMYYNEETKLLY